MLDLQKLADKVEKALAEETPESLTAWITGKSQFTEGKYLKPRSAEELKKSRNVNYALLVP